MNARFYFVVGAIMTAFFGFFALWFNREAMAGTAMFWFTVVGAAAGVVLLLIAVITAAVASGMDDHQRGDARRSGHH